MPRKPKANKAEREYCSGLSEKELRIKSAEAFAADEKAMAPINRR